MTTSPQLKTFVLGLSISAIVLAAFFTGALADRIFVIKPLDYFTGKRTANLPSTAVDTTSPLSDLLKGAKSVADVAEITSKSVVTVSIKKTQPVTRLNNFFGLGFMQPELGGRVEKIKQDIGSGFVISEGLIVTNKHVISDPAAEYSIIDADDKEYKVEKVYRDPANDLAILRVEGASFPTLPLGDSDQLRVGQSVIAIGTALGKFRHTVTTGVVSGLGRGIEATDGFDVESLEGVIQTDAAINPGNSGGPLLDEAGNVIGVSVATSVGADNVSFALPINLVKASLENFKQTGSFDRPFLGVQYRVISEQAALFNEVPQGAYLVQVVSDSPAASAGLKPGDIVVEFDGQSLKKNDLATLINRKKVGDTVKVTYWRDEKQSTISVTLKANSGQ